MYYPKPVARLIQELRRLPGIGPKSAQRLALHILNQPRDRAVSLAESIVSARDETVYCSTCCNIADRDPCDICSNQGRDSSIICAVEDPRDVIAMESTREFRGLYHVLHGAISPLDGIGPEELKVKELLRRVSDGVDEVILATNPNVEGEATAMYLARLLKPLGVNVTRIARGLPEGGDLEHVDQVTLAKALEGRRAL